MNAHVSPARGADDELRALMHDIERGTAPALLRAVKFGRRDFLKLTGMAGGGLLLAFHVGGDAAAASAPTSGDFAPNAFLRISPKGSILIYSKGPEIGQGIKTAFPLIIAEELDAKWSDVTVEQAPVNPAVYGRQSAGGSRSIPDSWDQLRQAGAVARAMLVAAAAATWKVPAAECSTRDSAVWNGKRSLKYGALASQAAALPVPDPSTVKLKTRAEYRLLGKSYTGVDNGKVVTGAPLFGIDQRLPDMKIAVYEKCPATGGKVRGANLAEVKQLPGVRDAFVIEGNGKPTEILPGVAIIADTTWAAFQARQKLRVEWDESTASKDSWRSLVARAKELGKQPIGEKTTFSAGDAGGALAGAARTVEAFYIYPFVPHAPLEPQNCTAWAHDGIVEFWAPTQTADRALTLVAGALGVPVEQIKINQTRVGGGFGRRLMNDYVCEAGAIAQRYKGPVKLVWTREQDMAHDFYRAGGFHSLAGGVDTAGKLVAWRNHFITFSTDGTNPVSGGNLPDQEFPAQNLPNYLLTQTMLPLATPCGPWRAPRSNSVAWVIQSFLHELSAAAGRDHRDFLLEIMGEPRLLPGGLNTGRAADVIKLVTEKAGWGRKLPDGHGMGLAFHFSHAGHFAEVAEVSVTNKRVRLHRVVVAGDIGPIVNMSGARNQCEGAVIDGYSTMLGLEVTMENGRIEQSNFHQYPILRMPNHPQVEVHFIQSDNPPTGVGEPALPPVAPAICNAIFAATGQRVRTLPLSKEGFSV